MIPAPHGALLLDLIPGDDGAHVIDALPIVGWDEADLSPYVLVTTSTTALVECAPERRQRPTDVSLGWVGHVTWLPGMDAHALVADIAEDVADLIALDLQFRHRCTPSDDGWSVPADADITEVGRLVELLTGWLEPVTWSAAAAAAVAARCASSTTDRLPVTPSEARRQSR